MTKASAEVVETQTKRPQEVLIGSNAEGTNKSGALQSEADNLRFAKPNSEKETPRLETARAEVAAIESSRVPSEQAIKTFKNENLAMERIGAEIFRDSSARHLARLESRDGQGGISKVDMEKYLAAAKAYKGGDKESRYPKDFVRAVDTLRRGYDSAELQPYKDEKGNFSKQSFGRGIFDRRDRLAELEKQSADQNVAKAPDKASDKAPDKASDKAPETLVAPSEQNWNSKGLKEASTIKAGEGPAAAADRILQALGGDFSRAQHKQLTRALKNQYIDDHGGKKDSIFGLKVGHSMLDSQESLNKILARLKDKELIDKLKGV
ncbi:MAG: hypothetical protein K2Y32_08155 [Candidatus Obscuribacterales bacterium]|nr:hypothetical protein [Candidatus Obscuribacterales bacterium]